MNNSGDPEERKREKEREMKRDRERESPRTTNLKLPIISSFRTMTHLFVIPLISSSIRRTRLLFMVLPVTFLKENIHLKL